MSQLQDARQAPAKMSALRKVFIFVIWIFPFFLAGCAYLIGTYYEPASALRSAMLIWPVPQSVYLWLLLLVLVAVAWLVAEFISVTSRETVVAALQLDVIISFLTALIFTGFGGWCVGTNTLEWWLIVPWGATIIDALTAGWLSVNNAAQKPFLSKKGSE